MERSIGERKMEWKEDQDAKLISIPSYVVRQILKGITPSKLTGLPVNVVEYIRVHQLTVRDILLLTGLSKEQVTDIEEKRRTYIHSQHKTGWYEKKRLNSEYGKYLRK